MFYLYLFRSGGWESRDFLFQVRPDHSHTDTPGICTGQLHSDLQPLSSSTGAAGVRGLAQGPLVVRQAVLLTFTAQITPAVQGFEPATLWS